MCVSVCCTQKKHTGLYGLPVEGNQMTCTICKYPALSTPAPAFWLLSNGWEDSQIFTLWIAPNSSPEPTIVSSKAYWRRQNDIKILKCELDSCFLPSHLNTSKEKYEPINMTRQESQKGVEKLSHFHHNIMQSSSGTDFPFMSDARSFVRSFARPWTVKLNNVATMEANDCLSLTHYSRYSLWIA